MHRFRRNTVRANSFSPSRPEGSELAAALVQLVEDGPVSKKFGSLGLSAAESRTGHLVPDTHTATGRARRRMQLAGGAHAATLGSAGMCWSGRRKKARRQVATRLRDRSINQCCRRTVKQYDVASIIDGNPSSRASRLPSLHGPLRPASAFQRQPTLESLPRGMEISYPIASANIFVRRRFARARRAASLGEAACERRKERIEVI